MTNGIAGNNHAASAAVAERQRQEAAEQARRRAEQEARREAEAVARRALEQPQAANHHAFAERNGHDINLLKARLESMIDGGVCPQGSLERSITQPLTKLPPLEIGADSPDAAWANERFVKREELRTQAQNLSSGLFARADDPAFGVKRIDAHTVEHVQRDAEGRVIAWQQPPSRTPENHTTA